MVDPAGREVELQAIDVLLAGGPEEPGALVLEGEAGIGKTTIWEAALRRARDAGHLRQPDAGADRGLLGESRPGERRPDKGLDPGRPRDPHDQGQRPLRSRSATRGWSSATPA